MYSLLNATLPFFFIYSSTLLNSNYNIAIFWSFFTKPFLDNGVNPDSYIFPAGPSLLTNLKQNTDKPQNTFVFK